MTVFDGVCACAHPLVYIQWYNVVYRQGERMNGGKVRGGESVDDRRNDQVPSISDSRENNTDKKKSSVYVCVCRAYSINHENQAP